MRKLALVDEVLAPRALLGNLQLLVPEHPAAFVVAQVLAAYGFLGVDDHEAVVGAIRRVPRSLQERVAVGMHLERVLHAHLRRLAVDRLVNPAPELPQVRLRFGIGSPFVVDVLVFAGQLAVVAAVAKRGVEYDSLLHLAVLLFTRSSRRCRRHVRSCRAC